MRRFWDEFRSFFRKGDVVLLLLCVVTTIFSCLVVASTTDTLGSSRYIVIQIAGLIVGALAYMIVSSIDVEVFSEHRLFMLGLNTVAFLMLIPFGKTIQGNRSWISVPFLPFDIQVAEVCKITFILIMASVMNSHQTRISSLRSIMHMGWHFGMSAGLSLVLSKDTGVTLIYLFIFVGMAFSGGISMLWVLAALGLAAAASPLVWALLSDYQKLRVEAIFNPAVDPNGIGVRHQTVRALKSLTGGGVTGQGLFEGTRTQTRNALYAQHTDFVFCAIGEELGFLGCLLVIGLLVAIVLRVVWVGLRSPDYMRRLICFGVASAMIFQIVSNLGMCLGVTPVIGLTLPFISYGGSSLLSLYIMVGLVSGVHARPSPTSQERYIRPPLTD